MQPFSVPATGRMTTATLQPTSLASRELSSHALSVQLSPRRSLLGRFWAFGAADAGINVSASRVVPVASVCAIGTSPLGGAEGRGVSECPVVGAGGITPTVSHDVSWFWGSWRCG